MQAPHLEPTVSGRIADPHPIAPWLFIDDDRNLCDLTLGPDGNSLQVVIKATLPPLSHALADEFDLASQAMNFAFEFESSEVVNGISTTRAEWKDGIQVDVKKCRELGMEERFCNLLTSGSDLLLESLPLPDTSRDNYK